jgi:hypothetical protein
MPSLNRVAKLLIIERLACFDSPSEVVKALKEELGLEVTRQQVWTYDASKPHLRERMSADLVAAFDLIRGRFNDDLGAIPIANKAYRLRVLQRLVEKYLDAGAGAIVAQFLEQAAKESGDAFTNRHKIEHSGKIGSEDPLTDEERADRVMAILERARARRDQGSD